MSTRRTLPTKDGSLLLTKDILIRGIERNACWSGLAWAFGSAGPRTVRELCESPHFSWCINNYILPMPHREEAFMLTGYSDIRGTRRCTPSYWSEGGRYGYWRSGHVRTVPDMYSKKGRPA